MSSVYDNVECSIKWCSRPAKRRGYCNTHYTRWRSGQDMEKPIALIQPQEGPRICSVCQEEKDISEFPARGFGHRAQCTNCFTDKRKQRVRNPNERLGSIVGKNEEVGDRIIRITTYGFHSNIPVHPKSAPSGMAFERFPFDAEKARLRACGAL